MIMLVQGAVLKDWELEALLPSRSVPISAAWNDAWQVGSTSIWALVGFTLPVTGDESA